MLQLQSAGLVQRMYKSAGAVALSTMFWAFLLAANLFPQESTLAIGRCFGTPIDHVWTGSMTGYGAVATNENAFVTYYNANRYVTVAKIDLRTCAVERKVLGSQFRGWDGHNYLTMTLDAQKRLHVSGNMHDLPLVYYLSKTPLSVADLEPDRMTGLQEDRVTYPRFLHLPNGELAYLYREGVAGNGVWYVNIFDGRSWKKATSKPLFADHWRDKSGSEHIVSAYPAPFVEGGGYYHTAIVWRGSETIGVGSNFRLSYAKTKDFSTWYTASGRPIAAPLDPANSEIIDDTGEEKGLVNNPKIAASPSGVAVTTFTKYDGNRNAVFAAYFQEGHWRIVKIAESAKFNSVSGAGSLVLPNFSAVTFEDGMASIQVVFPGEPGRDIALDPNTFVPLGNVFPQHLSAPPPPKEVIPEVPGLPNAKPGNAHADKDTPNSATVVFRWRADLNPGDHPPKCSPSAPTACNPPPSPLVMFVE